MNPSSMDIMHRSAEVDGLTIFYRERGLQDGPPVLLLHGFPTASHQYRRLMEALPTHFRLIAPDYPGFGHSQAPESASIGGNFVYSFDRLADIIESFCKQLGLQHFVIYAFDYGGPVAFRLAERRPDWIAGLILQNANAYEVGLSDMARQLVGLRPDQTGDADIIRAILAPDEIKSQHLAGVSDAARISPDGWTLDSAFLELPGRKQIQIDLAFDYRSNVERYDDWQQWLRDKQPPALVLWGRNDPFFLPAGAEAYRQDLPNAQVHLFDTGHFALEESLADIAPLVGDFLGNVITNS